jgi:cytidylate kinase
VEAHVVCISFSDGAGGREVARLVAERLGFRLVDDAIIAHAAREAGVEPGIVADVERRRSIVERLVRDMAAVDVGAYAQTGFVPATGQPLTAGDLLRSGDIRELIKSAVEETAAQGDVVIAAHAASAALESRDDVLRAFVTGSPDRRARRIAEDEGVEAREARRMVDRGDAARSDYLKRFYGQRSERPTSYDLVVNTDRLSGAEAARLIADAARSAAGD